MVFIFNDLLEKYGISVYSGLYDIDSGVVTFEEEIVNEAKEEEE